MGKFEVFLGKAVMWSDLCFLPRLTLSYIYYLGFSQVWDVSIPPTNFKVPLGNKGNQARNNRRLQLTATALLGKRRTGHPNSVPFWEWRARTLDSQPLIRNVTSHFEITFHVSMRRTRTSSFKSFLIEQLWKFDYGIDFVQEKLVHELIFMFKPRISCD